MSQQLVERVPMRGTVPGLASPLPLAGLLPAMLREDPFAVGLCAGLDEVLAPVLLTLDGFPAHLDVHTAPDDMLGWLAQWVGLITSDPEINGADPERLRELLAAAQHLHVRRGTRLGIERAVAAELGLDCEVVESGSAAWSDEPGQPLPEGDVSGATVPTIVVTVRPQPDQSVDTARLEAVLVAAIPVHIRCQVNVRS